MFRRTTLALVCVGVALVFIAINLRSTEGLTREELDRLWEGHMFSGMSAIYSNGRRTSYTAEHSYEWAAGNPSLAWLTKQGIAVGDLRETSTLGLFRKGGWVLEGGLLAKLQTGNGTMELYGKRVVQVEQVFILNFHRDRRREHSVEFFLLYRNREDSKARLLKKWKFAADEMYLSQGLSLGEVKGILRDYVEGKSVIFAVTGLKQAFEERVEIL